MRNKLNVNTIMKKYTGTLSLDQLIVARNKILENVINLVEEAQILFYHRKYARTHYLLAIANEEMGKYVIVLSAIIDVIDEKINWKSFWKKFINHINKTGTITHLENVLISSDKHFELPSTVQAMLTGFEAVKMASLYCDFHDGDFTNPKEIIDGELAEAYLDLTQNRLQYLQSTKDSDDLVRSFTKEDIKKYREKIFEGSPPETPEEVIKYIKQKYGIAKKDK